MLYAMTESTRPDEPRPEPAPEQPHPTSEYPRPEAGRYHAPSSYEGPSSYAAQGPYQAHGPYAAPPPHESAAWSPPESPSGPGYPGYQPPSGEHTEPLPAPAGGYGAYPPPETPASSPAPPPRRPMRMVLITAVVAALVGGGVGAGTVALTDNHNSTSSSAGLNTATATAPIAAKTDGTVAAAAAKIQPSVVTISVSGAQESGTGTGVIIRSDGYILTNNHVVSVAGTGGSITVLTDAGQQATAKIVGVDAPDDLAVIKVDGLSNLTAATFAKSAKLVVGQAVVAVGAPLGLSNTVTSGIVSNTARPVRAGDNDQAVFDAVQTDAAINPGNSGGPLVDLNGNVVGINAAIATASSGGLQVPGQTQQSGSIGIGFAIPSDEASRVADQLISSGKATHAVIGVSVNSASANSQSGQSATIGAVLRTVESNGPAAAAGLKAGDVITMVGQQRIEDADGLIAAIRSHAPNDKVTLTYTRDGKPATTEVTLGTSTD
jgi:putative serine protease PepD